MTSIQINSQPSKRTINGIRARNGKTAKAKLNGHQPRQKNRKPEGERGHLKGRSHFQWLKSFHQIKPHSRFTGKLQGKRR